MLRTLPSLALRALRLLTVLLTLGVVACADTITSNEASSSNQLLKDYDKTLTKTEQQAVISDLQGAKAKQQDEVSPATTGSTGAKSAENQN